jgi:hypothetical protein
MPNAIDNAIARLQDIAAACTSVTFKSAPDYPVDNVEPFPCSVAYISGGVLWFTNATVHHNLPQITIEFHFSRVNLKQAYQQIDLLALEFPKRLAGDPTLNNTIETIVATPDAPVTYVARPFQWSAPGVTPVIVSQALIFTIPIKSLQAPTT